MVDKTTIQQELVEKWSIKQSLAHKLADIVVFLADKEEVKTESLVNELGLTATTAKRYLRQLTELGYQKAHGGNRNGTCTLESKSIDVGVCYWFLKEREGRALDIDRLLYAKYGFTDDEIAFIEKTIKPMEGETHLANRKWPRAKREANVHTTLKGGTHTTFKGGMNKEVFIMTLEQTYQKWLSIQPLSEQQQRKLSMKFSIEYSYNSNHKEGNTLTYGQTELLLLFGKVCGEASLKDVNDMKASEVSVKMME